MLNQYETVFILIPVLSQDQIKETVQQIKDVITKNDGNILDEENWGLKKMAYSIQNKATGFYGLLSYKAPGEAVKQMETFYNRNEKIVRYINIKLDKHSIEYAERRKKRLIKETNKTKKEKK